MKPNHTRTRLWMLIPLIVGLFAGTPVLAKSDATHTQGEKVTVTGEVVDLMCYLDHGAKGDEHQSCARKCIQSNGPVGLLTDDGDLYLLIGDHEPANDRLAKYAAETITVEGKYAERNGMKMVENIRIRG